MKNEISLKILTPKKKIIDNKTFWKTVKPFISNKCRPSENTALVMGDDSISDRGQVASIFNEFFANVVKNLNKAINEEILCDTNEKDDPVLKATEKSKKYPSIEAIKNVLFLSKKFHMRKFLNKYKT